MANKKAEVYSNFHRVLILSLLKKKEFTPSELSKKLNLARVSVYHHLTWLENKKLVRANKLKNTIGNPVKYTTTEKAQPIPPKILEWANKLFKFDKEMKSESFKA